MKILTVIGARPQFIKAAPVSLSFIKNDIEEILIHTGQHYDHNLSEIFFNELNIPSPKYNLNVGSGLHGEQTGKMLIEIEEKLIKEDPDALLVYGDTNSTLAGALAAKKLHIPVIHIEAGLRSFDDKMPEEVNRILTDHISQYLFCPSDISKNQLMKEGIDADKIHVVGDVMYDAVKSFSKIANNKSDVLSQNKLINDQYILATIHRAENTDNLERLEAIFGSLNEISHSVEVCIPLHPRTEKELRNSALLSKITSSGIKIIEPVGFLDMLVLEANAKLIVTDSGGIQKEAYYLETPCVTLRDSTEWVELVELGWNLLVPPVSQKEILEGINKMLDFNKKTPRRPVYGKGNTAELITKTIFEY